MATASTAQMWAMIEDARNEDQDESAEAQKAWAALGALCESGSEAECGAGVAAWMDNFADVSMDKLRAGGLSPLQRAVAAGRSAQIALAIIQGGAAPDWGRDGTMTPLMLAVSKGSEQCARLLLSRGANPNRPGPEGVTALMMAAALGQQEMARLMGRHSGRVDCRDHMGWSACDWALERGGAAMLATLADIHKEMGGADSLTLSEQRESRILPEPGDEAPSGLVAGSMTRSIQRLRMGLAAGEDPSAVGAQGETPLTACVKSNFAAGLELLLDRGAREDVPNGEGLTPLALAASLGRDECARLLLQEGADPSLAVAGGASPLLAAARAGRSRMALQLIQAGADFEGADPEGATRALWDDAIDGFESDAQALADALCERLGKRQPGAHERAQQSISGLIVGEVAARGLEGDGAGVEWAISILRAGVKEEDPSEADKRMLSAALRGSAKGIETAVADGARVDAAMLDSDGASWIDALAIAVKTRSPEKVAILLALGANPSGSLRARHKALAMAVRLGDVEITRLLLDKGANPNGCFEENPPLHAAVALQDLEIAKMLIDAGALPWARDGRGRPALCNAATVEMVGLLAMAGAQAATAIHGGGSCVSGCAEEVRDAVEALAAGQEAAGLKEELERELSVDAASAPATRKNRL